MQTPTFWINQIPRNPLVMTVIDQRGETMDLSLYQEVDLIMLGPDNRKRDLPGTLSVNASGGQVVYNWEGTSPFDRAGEYVIQLELKSPGVVDYSAPSTFRVRKLGQGRL